MKYGQTTVVWSCESSQEHNSEPEQLQNVMLTVETNAQHSKKHEAAKSNLVQLIVEWLVAVVVVNQLPEKSHDKHNMEEQNVVILQKLKIATLINAPFTVWLENGENLVNVPNHDQSYEIEVFTSQVTFVFFFWIL